MKLSQYETPVYEFKKKVTAHSRMWSCVAAATCWNLQPWTMRKCSYHTSETEVFLRLAVSSSARGIFLLFTMSMRLLTCAAAVWSGAWRCWWAGLPQGEAKLRPWLARYKGRRPELQQKTGCWDARGDHRKSCPRSIDTPKLGRTMGTGPISGIDWHHCDPFGSFSKQSRSVFESQQALFSLWFWWCGPFQVVFSCATGFGPALLGPPCCFR
jgi:hypothetical protein